MLIALFQFPLKSSWFVTNYLKYLTHAYRSKSFSSLFRFSWGSDKLKLLLMFQLLIQHYEKLFYNMLSFLLGWWQRRFQAKLGSVQYTSRFQKKWGMLESYWRQFCSIMVIVFLIFLIREGKQKKSSLRAMKKRLLKSPRKRKIQKNYRVYWRKSWPEHRDQDALM